MRGDASLPGAAGLPILELRRPEDVAAALADMTEEERVTAVRALRARVDELVRTHREAAVEASELLLAARGAAPELDALVERGRAMALHAASRSLDARRHYESALLLHEARGEAVEVARVLRSLVDVLQMAGESRLALERAKECRAVLARIEQPVLEAQLECNVGNVHFRLDRYGDARASYERAIRAFERAGDGLGAAHARCNLANVETNAHRFDAARSLFEAAQAAFEEAGHVVFELDCRFGLAYLDHREGDFVGAIEALESIRRAYDSGGVKPSGGPLCDLDLAEVHLRLGATHDAAECAARASAAFEELGMLYEASKAKLFVATANAGRDPRGAARSMQEAARGFEELGNHTRAALVTLQRAALDGMPSTPIEELERAASVLEAGGDRFLGQAGRLFLARGLARAGRTHEARACLESLMPQATGTSPFDRAFAVEALRETAVLARCEDGSRAEALLREAVQQIDLVYEGLAWADARLAFFGRSADVFLELATLLIRRGDSELPEVIELLEAARERRRSGHPAAEEDPETTKLRARVDTLLVRSMRASLGSAVGPRGGGARDSRALEGELASAMDALASHRRRALRHLGWTTEPSPPTSARDESQLAKLTGCIALRFVTHRDELWRIAEHPDGQIQARLCFSTPARMRSLEEAFQFQVGKLRHGGDFVARHASVIERSIARILQELGDTLFEELPPAHPLLLVPDDGLLGLPLHAAIVDGAPLFAFREVSYARSRLDLLQSRRAAARARGGQVVVAFDRTESLPAIVQEVAAVERCWGASASLLDGSSGVDALLSLQTPPRVLHVAAHGAYRPEHPLFSGLLIGERVLAAIDLVRLSVEGAIVTLSGCETSRVPTGDQQGTGSAGPERALLDASAAAVLGSLAIVDDSNSAVFMEAFHSRLASGAACRSAYVEALREVRRLSGGLVAATSWTLAGDPDATARG